MSQNVCSNPFVFTNPSRQTMCPSHIPPQHTRPRPHANSTSSTQTKGWRQTSLCQCVIYCYIFLSLTHVHVMKCLSIRKLVTHVPILSFQCSSSLHSTICSPNPPQIPLTQAEMIRFSSVVTWRRKCSTTVFNIINLRGHHHKKDEVKWAEGYVCEISVCYFFALFYLTSIFYSNLCFLLR